MLANPVQNYPGYFQPDGLFHSFPYLLPNIVCTTVVILGLVVGFLFLEETHEDKKDQRDVGRLMGQWMLRILSWRNHKVSSSKLGYFEETLSYIAEDEKLDYRAATPSPILVPSRCTSPESETSQMGNLVPARLTLRQAFTRQVTLIVVSYGILAL